MKTKRQSRAVEYHIHVEVWMDEDVYDKYVLYRKNVECFGEGQLCLDDVDWLGSGFDTYRSPNYKDAVRFIKKLMDLGVKKEVIGFFDLVRRTF